MNITHPTDQQLRLFVIAQLDAEQEKLIEKHLARCPQCTKRVFEIERSPQDLLLQKVKAAAEDDSTEAVAPVARLSQVNQSVSNAAKPGIIIQGDMLGGNLRLEEKLGRGGMGEAWKAFDQTAERFVVLKFVPGEMQHHKEAMASVRSSFQKIHALQHQHICPVYNLVDDPKYGLYIVMKYIDGLTLSEYRRRLSDKDKKMSFNDIVQILWAVAKGLDYAHERKVIHRDIKPGNIMIGRKDGVQIIDFGLAEEIRTLLSQTSDAEVMSSSGTRPYMAPEQWQGRIQDARTDQYALAATAYELFAGHVPFSGNDVELLKNTVLNDSPEPIANLPEYVNASLAKALSKKRDERYENCKAFVKALVTKSETPDFEEVEERKFPEGDVMTNDLPSDKASGGNVAPVWLPDGLSGSSSPSKLPTIAISTSSSSKKNGLPSWVMPTISALAMLVVCMACFLGYTMMDRQAKPHQPVVAKKPEKVVEPIVEPEPVSVQEETPKVASTDSEENTPDEPMPEITVEEKQEPSETNSEENSDVSISFPIPESEPQANVQPEPIRLTPEPVEATEARQQYDEAVDQAIKPYREELEKELAVAKKNGVLNLVLALEAELKHLASDDCTKLTPFRPEKRSLFNTKMRFKKKIETALEDYQKRLETLSKELVRTERTQEAVYVQDMRNHLFDPKMVETIPVRTVLPEISVVKMMLEVDLDVKGRFIITKGKTTDPYDVKFRGTPFNFSAFPKAQAFRGENGMGRVLFDFRNTDSEEFWKKPLRWNWWANNGISIDHQNKTLSYISGTKDDWPGVGIHKLRLPCRIYLEFIDKEQQLPALSFDFFVKDKQMGCVVCSAQYKNGRLSGGGSYRIPGETKNHGIGSNNVEEGKILQIDFQLPKKMVQDDYSLTWASQINLSSLERFPQGLKDKVDIILVDITGIVIAATGLSVKESQGRQIIDKVDENSSAFRTGLQEGDEIVRFNGMKRSAEQIQKILDNVKFGDLITIAVVRDGEEKVFRFHAE